MNPICPRCHQDNPEPARFCGACGCALTMPFRGRAHRRNWGGVLIVAVVLGALLVAYRPSRAIQRVAGVWPSLIDRIVSRQTERKINLEEKESHELYELLAPQDVGVIVSWNGDRIDVRGSDEEVETLVSLAGILSRDEPDRHGSNYSMAMAHANRDRVTRRYPLPEERGRMLQQLLQHANLSLSVSCVDDTISIGASDEDHMVLKQVVSILNGERF